MMTSYTKVQDIYRKHVLAAFDAATQEILGDMVGPQLGPNPGARDRDLRKLFKSIDDQIDRIAEANEVVFHDEWIGSAL